MNGTHSPSCHASFLDCTNKDNPERDLWLGRTNIVVHCDALNDDRNFDFGMFADAFTSQIAKSNFKEKYFYCLWWGLKSLRYCLMILQGYSLSESFLHLYVNT